MITYPIVSFGLYNLEIKSDGVLACGDKQFFSNLNDLATDNVVPNPYATFEPNYWLLDGNYKFLPTDDTKIHAGLYSVSMSNASGIFGTPPVLTINFGEEHNTDGLILRFSQGSEDWANSINVKFYDSANTLILSEDYVPDSWEYEIDLVAEKFKKLVITFYSTNKPYRYLRLTGVDYGQLIVFSGEEIKEAIVTEEINMTSMEAVSNDFTVKVISENSEFSIVNPSGNFERLAQKQPLSVYQSIGGKTVPIGRYYLDEWKNTSDTEVQFDCIDALGIMDRIPFRGGIWLPDGIASQYLIEQIMMVAQIPFDLDSDLYDIPVIGWIPKCSCREALQHVAFAIGAYIDCSRSSLVKIYKTTIASDHLDAIELLPSQYGVNDQTTELKKLVTGIEVTAHNYSEGLDTITLFSGDLEPGQYEVSFSQPAHSLSLTGGDLIERGANYAILSVSNAGTVKLVGLSYLDSQQVISQYANVGTNVLPNILQVTNATLVSKENGTSVVSRLFNYYAQRYQRNIKLYGEKVQIGDVVLVSTVSAKKIRGVIEKLKIDLAGGYIQDADIVGVVE